MADEPFSETLRRAIAAGHDALRPPNFGYLGGTWVLQLIGGWHVGCQNERENPHVVNELLRADFVGYRTHYAPAIPEGSQAYEITDKGLQFLRDTKGHVVELEARLMREFYRAGAKQHGPKAAP